LKRSSCGVHRQRNTDRKLKRLSMYFVERWKELWATLYLRQESTMVVYESQLRILERKFTDYRMDEITTIMIQELYAQLLKKVDYSSARSTMSVLNSLLTVVIEWHHVNINPMPTIKKPKQKVAELDEEDEGEVEIFTIPELQRFMEDVQKMWYGCNYGFAFLVLLWLGLRSSELFAVRWMDIDIEAKQLKVRRNTTEGGLAYARQKRGKGMLIYLMPFSMN